MGFIKKAMKGVSKDDIQQADSGGGFRGLDAGDYEAEIVDVKIGEYGPNTKNAGRERLELELKIKRNWDGDKVNPEVKLRTMVGLFSHWNNAQKSLNFTLFQFLKSLEDGWDYDEDEALIDLDDEQDAQETLMGLRLNVRLGYRITEPTADYPTPNVFNEITRFLRPDADLGPDTRLGDYDSYKEKHLGSTTAMPARSAASRDTNADFQLK